MSPISDCCLVNSLYTLNLCLSSSKSRPSPEDVTPEQPLFDSLAQHLLSFTPSCVLSSCFSLSFSPPNPFQPSSSSLIFQFTISSSIRPFCPPDPCSDLSVNYNSANFSDPAVANKHFMMPSSSLTIRSLTPVGNTEMDRSIRKPSTLLHDMSNT